MKHEEENVIHQPNGKKFKFSHSDPLLITARICEWDKNRVCIDIGDNLGSFIISFMLYMPIYTILF